MRNSPQCHRNPNRSWPEQLALLSVIFLLSPAAVSRAQDKPLVDYIDINDKEAVTYECRQHIEAAAMHKRLRLGYETLLEYKSKEARLRDELSALRNAIANNTLLDASVFEAAYTDTRRLSIAFNMRELDQDKVAAAVAKHPADLPGYSAASLLALYPKVRSELEVQLTKILKENSTELSHLVVYSRAMEAESQRYYEHFRCDEVLATASANGDTGTETDGGTETAAKTFADPTLSGNRIDRCLYFGQQCDEPAASAWCRTAGYQRATEWKWDYIGADQRTLVQGSGAFCEGSGCGGFTSITCSP